MIYMLGIAAIVLIVFLASQGRSSADPLPLPSGSSFHEEALNAAQSQLGVNETSDPEKISEYLRACGWTGPNTAWCAAFVSWVYQQPAKKAYLCGATVTSIIAYASKAGGWKRITSPGDLDRALPGSFYAIDQTGDGVPDHCGIIESWDGSTLVCIDGNYSDSVERVYRRQTLSKIVGFSTITGPSGLPCGG